jgi:hypothetical protein
MAFDYTTPTNVFAYLGSAGTGNDPVNEATEMQRLVTGMSRAVDQWCNQAFSLATYSAQTLRAVVDVEGVLTAYPAVPTMSAPTIAEWGSRIYTPIDLTTIAVAEAPGGATVRVFGSYGALRGQRLNLRLSYTGGYANLAALPADLTWAVDALCAWAYQKRSAPIDATAAPAFGQLYIPSNWPGHIKTMLSNYRRWVV